MRRGPKGCQLIATSRQGVDKEEKNDSERRRRDSCFSFVEVLLHLQEILLQTEAAITP